MTFIFLKISDRPYKLPIQLIWFSINYNNVQLRITSIRSHYKIKTATVAYILKNKISHFTHNRQKQVILGARLSKSSLKQVEIILFQSYRH